MEKKAVKKKKAATRTAKKTTKKTTSKTAKRTKTAAKAKKKTMGKSRTTAKGKTAAKRTTAKTTAKKTTAKKKTAKTTAKKTTAKRPTPSRKSPSVPKKVEQAPVVPMRQEAPSMAEAPTPTPVVSPTAPQISAEQPIGTVTHYYSHLSVAVVQLNEGTLRVGDTIHIKGHTTDLRQPIESMEVEHQSVQEASAGQLFGLKVRDHVREHDQVYKD